MAVEERPEGADARLAAAAVQVGAQRRRADQVMLVRGVDRGLQAAAGEAGREVEEGSGW